MGTPELMVEVSLNMELTSLLVMAVDRQLGEKDEARQLLHRLLRNLAVKELDRAVKPPVAETWLKATDDHIGSLVNARPEGQRVPTQTEQKLLNFLSRAVANPRKMVPPED